LYHETAYKMQHGLVSLSSLNHALLGDRGPHGRHRH
jgi:hypothetical protein